MKNKANDKILLAMHTVVHIIRDIITFDTKGTLDHDKMKIMALLWEENHKYKETGDPNVLETYKIYFKQSKEILTNAMEEINKYEN